jgi:hypothetical protein
MQIGSGKQGIVLGEYEKSSDLNAVIGYIQPSCENPQWILWFTNRGDAILHRSRSLTGAVLDEGMKIKGRLDKPLTKKQKSEIARLKSPKLTIKDGIAILENFSGKI